MFPQNGVIIMKTKKLLSCLTSLALSLSAVTGLGIGTNRKAVEAQAAAVNWKFDLGGNGAASGFTGVSASDGYNSSRGYGFAQTGNVANVSASGSGALSDAVQFKSGADGNTFNVDLPKGLYQVKVTTGNSPRTSIKIENMLQMINLTGNNAVETIQVPVTDGQLNIMAVAGMNNAAYTISAIEITQLNTTGEMKPTIWICGDSTVANYYNCADSSQHGWGQFIGRYVDTNYWEIRNQASSGQYAKGFVNGGQFAPIEYYGKSGDIYVISIGINDTNYSNGDEYYSVVTDMVKRAKAKGMSVVLVKQQGRRGDLQRSPLLSGRWFGGQLDTVGKEQGVPVIDLFTAWQNFGLSVGYDGMASYYAIQANGSNDDLHQSMKGAVKIAELMSQLYDFSSAGGATLDESLLYSFRNVNSGLYMEIDGGKASSGANIQQWGRELPADHNVWKVKSADDGYYYICAAENSDLVLDVDGAKGTNGQNIALYTFKGSDNQQFKFTKNSDGSYKIRTKISGDKSGIEVANAYTDPGANVQQWEINGVNCQDWYVEKTILPMNGDVVKNFIVLDEEHAAPWAVKSTAGAGMTLFGDRDFTALNFPSAYLGADYIMTACDSKNYRGDLAQFTAGSDATVCVAMDTRVTELASWLSGYTKTADTIQTSNDVTLQIYAKDVKSGEKVILGDNGTNYNCVNYVAFVKAKDTVTTTAPATTDIPPVTTVQPVVNVLLGDANCDGDVTMADAAAILQFLGNSELYPLSAAGKINADVAGNRDGITPADALLIQRYKAGLDSLPTYTPPSTTIASTTIATTAATTTDPHYFAVDQTWDDGWAEDTNSGFTKTTPTASGSNVGYVNLNNVMDSSITFTVNVESKGNYMTHIRFANGSANDRKMKIVVNGDTNAYWMQSFPGTDDWTSWTEYGIVLPLDSGKNTIQMISATAEGGPNLDYITLTLTDEPYAEIYDPNSGIGNVGGTKPTIYIAGDSTVQSYRESYAPQQGWGYYLSNYFSDDVTVANHSIAGRSTKKFYDEGRWQTIADSLKPGDYVMIQFAINDAGSANADRYAPTCGNVNTPSAGSYEWYMTEFIKSAQDKGATPILVTTVIGMKAYSNGRFNNSYTNYCDACKNLAKKYAVPCIDLNTLMVNHYNSIGYDKAVKYHLMGVVSGSTDGTHFCTDGANVVAGLVAKDVKSQGIAPLSGFAK